MEPSNEPNYELDTILPDFSQCAKVILRTMRRLIQHEQHSPGTLLQQWIACDNETKREEYSENKTYLNHVLKLKVTIRKLVQRDEI